jgi:hypothetical protein
MLVHAGALREKGRQLDLIRLELVGLQFAFCGPNLHSEALQ